MLVKKGGTGTINYTNEEPTLKVWQGLYIQLLQLVIMSKTLEHG